VVGSNHNKTEKRPEKFTLQWQHHPLLVVIVQKTNSPYRHVKEVANIVTTVIIFIEAAMERPNLPLLLTVVRDEEGEPNPQYQKTWHGEN
jgi:hypothetical protein